MRALAIALLAACSGEANPDAPPATFCGDGIVDEGEACDDANAIAGDGCDRACQREVAVTTTWTFYPMLGAPAGTCRANVAKVEVFAETGAMGTFACTAGRGDLYLSGPIDRVFARAVDANGDAVVTSLPRFPTVQARVDLAFYEDAGFVRAFTQPMPCMVGQAPAMRVSDGVTTTTKMFPNCAADRDVAAGVMVSDPLRPGTYDVTVTTNAGATYMRTGVVVGTNNAVTDLELAP